MIAMVALAAITLRTEAQTPTPAVGSEQICRVVTFTVDEMDKFKPLVQKLVAATEKEPGALQYEYNVGADQKTVDISYRYANSKAKPVLGAYDRPTLASQIYLILLI